MKTELIRIFYNNTNCAVLVLLHADIFWMWIHEYFKLNGPILSIAGAFLYAQIHETITWCYLFINLCKFDNCNYLLCWTLFYLKVCLCGRLCESTLFRIIVRLCKYVLYLIWIWVHSFLPFQFITISINQYEDIKILVEINKMHEISKVYIASVIVLILSFIFVCNIFLFHFILFYYYSGRFFFFFNFFDVLFCTNFRYSLSVWFTIIYWLIFIWLKI